MSDSIWRYLVVMPDINDIPDTLKLSTAAILDPLHNRVWSLSPVCQDNVARSW